MRREVLSRPKETKTEKQGGKEKRRQWRRSKKEEGRKERRRGGGKGRERSRKGEELVKCRERRQE